MQGLIGPLKELAEFEELCKNKKKDAGMIRVCGCVNSQKSHMMYAIGDGCKYKVIACSSESKARALYEEYKMLSEDVYLYPSKDFLFYQADIRSKELVKQRMEVLEAVIQKEQVTVVTSFDAFMDVLLPKEQILEAVDAIRKGNAVMSFPYDGRFYMLPQEDSLLLKKREMNMEECCQKIYEYVLAHGPNSVGGAFLVNKNVYIKYGGENQHFYGWGPEDAERCKRMEILGLPIYRAQGPLLHLFHPRMQNSWFGNQRLEYANRMEFIRVAGMTRSQLLQYISGWSIGI